MHICQDSLMGSSFAGVLGPGQEAGAEEALPIGQLAHLLLQVHQVAGALLRQVRPGVPERQEDHP